MEQKKSLVWEVFEHEEHKKSPDWFWFVWIISIAVIIVSIMSSSFSFAILVFVSAFALSIQAVQKPKLVRFELTDSGIIIHSKKYLYENLDSYWVKEDDDEHSRIIIKSKKAIIPYLIIPIGDMEGERIDNFLIDHLEKTKLKEPPHHKITKYL